MPRPRTPSNPCRWLHLRATPSRSVADRRRTDSWAVRINWPIVEDMATWKDVQRIASTLPETAQPADDDRSACRQPRGVLHHAALQRVPGGTGAAEPNPRARTQRTPVRSLAVQGRRSGSRRRTSPISTDKPVDPSPANQPAAATSPPQIIGRGLFAEASTGVRAGIVRRRRSVG